MGFFDRIWNVIKGIFSGAAGDLERRNPEAVYESAIDERVKKHAELKKAVSGIVYLRNKIASDLETREKELKDVLVQLPIAVEEGEDEAALVLIQKKDELTKQIADLKVELEKLATQAEEAKKGLVSFTGEIEKLKREKLEMLARKQTAEARITIQETLDGLSTDADIKALDTVREHIHKLQAEADVGSEIKGESLDAKLEKIKAKAVDAGARAQLEEMKKQSAARKTASEAAATAAGGSDPGRRTI
jgi:phage shock protein A